MAFVTDEVQVLVLDVVDIFARAPALHTRNTSDLVSLM